MNNFLTKARRGATASFKSLRAGAKELSTSQKSERPAFVRFSVKEQTLFAKRLSFLIKAGVPLLECLVVIRDQTKSKSKRAVFDKVIKDITNGKPLAGSLARFGSLFGEFTVNLIRVGESSGALSQNLAYLADELAKKAALRRKVVGTMVYPAFISASTLGVTAILTAYIFPKLMPIFTSLHVELPLTTRILIGVSDYLRAWGLLTVGALIAFGFLFAFIRSRVFAVRYYSDYFVLKVPISSSLARSYNLATFCRTLALLLRSGIHLTEAITIVGDSMRNRVYSQSCLALRAGVVKGEPLSRGLSRQPHLYPDLLAHMVHIGESTGNLTHTLQYLAEMYEGEVEELSKSLSSSIEPVLMIVMGIIVGLIAVSVITPIYAITQHLQPK